MGNRHLQLLVRPLPRNKTNNFFVQATKLEDRFTFQALPVKVANILLLVFHKDNVELESDHSSWSANAPHSAHMSAKLEFGGLARHFQLRCMVVLTFVHLYICILTILNIYTTHHTHHNILRVQSVSLWHLWVNLQWLIVRGRGIPIFLNVSDMNWI